MAKEKVKSMKDFLAELDAPPVRKGYRGTGKLNGKVALITGGDSGIGRSVAVYFAMEGADIAIAYRKSDDDANETQKMVEEQGRSCLLIKTDLSKEANCNKVVEKIKKRLGRLDVLVNNAGTHEEDDKMKG